MIYRFTTRSKSGCIGLPCGNIWNMDIYNSIHEKVGTLNKNKIGSCCNSEVEWVVEFPNNLKDPNKKLLLCYVVPYI